jgi:thiol-disulfide isomerase/thioredoxin
MVIMEAAMSVVEQHQSKKPNWARRLFLAAAAIAAAVPLTFVCSTEDYLALGGVAQAAPVVPDGALPAIFTAKQWLNGKRLTRADLRGKVVLVNFWTYSCINCLRALPHYREWAAKYRDQGLVVVGVHSPEFSFEHQSTNVNQAVGTLGVNYPVAIDSDFGIWKAFNNQAWPAIYIFDAKGHLRSRVLGEGEYDKTEQLIRQLLAEAKRAPSASGASVRPVVATGTQMAADLSNLGSPETYVGYEKAIGFAPTSSFARDRDAVYDLPVALPLNNWALGGHWKVGAEFGQASQPGSAITYRFHARDLHLVLGSANGKPVRFRVKIDGGAPGASHGSDTDASGNGAIGATKLYQLVRQSGQVRDRTFTIEFLDAGARAYSFTFG